MVREGMRRSTRVSLTHGQRYVLRELRILFGRREDEDLRTSNKTLLSIRQVPAPLSWPSASMHNP